MRNFFILLILIISACSPSKSTYNTVNEINIDLNKNYIFEEYVSKLISINKNKSFPNINDIPD